MSPVPLTAWEQAQYLKLHGKFCFDNNRIDDAIKAYTQAIRMCPDDVVYWTNRALCYRKRKQWDRVEEDCIRAIQLNGQSVKAHYMLGLVFFEKCDYVAAVKELEKALELQISTNSGSSMVDDIWQLLAKAKYEEWKDLFNKRSSRMKKLSETCQKALKDYCLSENTQVEDSSRENANEDLQILKDLKEVFQKATQLDVQPEVPDYLCCKISLSILRDPVVTPCGFTYEKAEILRHLNEVGKFEPLTSKRLEENQLVPNIAIKQAVRAFLDEHGWAYQGLIPPENT